MAAEISIQGADGIIEKLNALADAATIEKALEKACLLVERDAKINAQRVKDTGNDTSGLAGSIKSEVEGLEGRIFTNLFFAPYIEYGTGIEAKHPTRQGRQDVPWVYVANSGNTSTVKKHYTPEKAEKVAAFLKSQGLDARITSGEKPQPFMRPALDDNRDTILNTILGGIIQK